MLGVTAVNDGPTLTGDLSATVNEGGSYELHLGDLNYSDPDDDFSGVTFTVSNASHGEVRVNGVAATSFDADDILFGRVRYWHDGSDAPGSGFNVSVEDGNEDGSAPFAQAFAITVNNVNDAPVLTGDLSATVAEGGIYVLTATDLGYTDPDDVATGVTFSATDFSNGSIYVNGNLTPNFTAAELAAGLVVFTLDGSETTAAGFNVRVEDGNEDFSTPVSQPFSITVSPVNDAPQIFIDLSPRLYVEQGVAFTINGGVGDVELDVLNGGVGNYSGSEIVVSSSLADGSDVFGFSGLSFVTLDGNALRVAGNTIATVTSGVGTISITFTDGNGTIPTNSHFNEIFRAVTYANTSDAPPATVSLQITVRDHAAVDPQESSASIQVQITPQDDAPIFDGGLSLRTIGVASGTSAVGTITATDDGVLPVTYSINGGDDAALFSIDPGTGALTFLTPVNYGQSGFSGPNIYGVVIEASDGVLSNFQFVDVRVLNPANTAPVLTGFATGAALSTPENYAAVELYQLLATDNEGQLSGNGLVWSITGGADASKFILDAFTGQIRFAVAPDHEAATDAGGDNIYDVTVRVTDEFGAGLFDEQALTIEVLAYANAPPEILGVFGAGNFTVTAPENLSTSFSIPINANDPEGETTGNGLVWSIVSVANGGAADAGDFVIDANTGGISFAVSPDFEAPADADANNSYKVTVKVTDQFGAGLSDQKVFTVNINDVNEGGGNAAPTITGLDTVRQVLPNGVAILLDANVNIADAELDAANAGAGDYGGATLTVQRQGGGVQGSDIFGFNLAQLALAGITVLQDSSGLLLNGNPFATSLDSNPLGANGVLSMRFEIGATTALVDAVIRAITFQNGSSSALDFTLGYTFNDGAGGTVTDTILISATDGSSNASLITSAGGRPSAILAVLENKTAITTILAEPPVDVPGAIAFSISGGLDAARFAINATTGALAFIAAPDYETPADSDLDNVYDVVIRAETTGIAAGLYDSQAISVVIADIEGVTLTGTAKANTLTGGAERDILLGLGGNDILIGKGSGDRLDGGLGSDTASYASAGSAVAIDLQLGGGLGSEVSGDIFISIENLTGSRFNDTLYGSSAGNILDGGAGADTLRGLGGDDIYVIDNAGDIVDELASGSSGTTDLVQSKISFNLSDAVHAKGAIENLTLLTGALNGTGNALANVITGNGVANTLSGLGGIDTLIGGAGKDTMTGGLLRDVFDFNKTTETGKTAATRDVIKDFTHLLDDIDLSTIDANSKIAGNQSFSFLAVKGAAFTGVAGQLHWLQINAAGTVNDKTIIEGDIDGDKVGDFQIELSGLKTLTASDFIL